MSNVLVGKWLHSIKVKKDGCKIIEWQGHVVGMPAEGVYLVQLLSWVEGGPTAQVMVEIKDMKNWAFYNDNEDMLDAYEVYHQADVLGQHKQHKAKKKG